ncbi:MAG: ABC transporter ATP-binding protein [Candidatus Aerophobetes bacterium]|nr:ABC transporter ATP-binding protein [Candidatus Aerophobetes bacterium]
MSEEKTVSKIKKGLHLLFRFYREYVYPYKGKFFIIWVLHVLFAGVLIVPPFLIKQLIDEGIKNKDLHLIWILAISVAGIFVALALIDKIRNFWGHLAAQRVTYNLRNKLYSHLQKLSFSFYDNAKTGELLSRIIDDLNVVQEVIYHWPENVITSGGTILLTGVMVFYLNWKLALVSLSVMPVILILGYFISLGMFKGSREVRKKKASLASRVEDNLSGMRIIQAFTREDYEIERFDRENREHYRSRINVISYMSWLFPISVSTLGISLSLTAGYGGYQVISGAMTVGALTAFIMYLQRFMWPLLTLAMMSEPITRFLASIERYFKYIDMGSDIKDSFKAESLKSVRGDIQFRNVWFKYDKEVLLKNMNLHIHPGETVALVGPSGSGKTTTTKLIPRFYEPYKGKILIDGKDIRKIKLHSLRANIGIVMQNDYLFSDSLMNNIAYGRLSASNEEIIEAAKQANVHQFVKELPEGYKTQIGERGIKVSEGQAQRISIARAVLKDPPILIFDEATSSVDSGTELLIQQALERLMGGKTCIIIAHRLSTILGVDRILFIDDGQIAEEGNHEELLQKNNKYAHFYNLQFNAASRRI